jgi:hypothetical protein
VGVEAHGAQVDRAAWLGKDLLLAVGRLGNRSEGEVDTVAQVDGRRVRVDARTHYLEDPGAAGDGAPKRLLIARFGDLDGLGALDRIELGRRDDVQSIDSGTIESAVTDWRTLLAEELGGSGARYRVSALEAVVRAAGPSLLRPDGLSLAKELGALRDELRPRGEPSEARPDETQAVAVDAMMAIDERSFFICGWTHDEERTISRLTAISPEGDRAELLEIAFRRPRPDIKEL